MHSAGPCETALKSDKHRICQAPHASFRHFASGPIPVLGTVFQNGSRLPFAFSSAPVSPQRKSQLGSAEFKVWWQLASVCVCVYAQKLNQHFSPVIHYQKVSFSLTTEIIISYLINCFVRQEKKMFTQLI